MHKLLQIKSQCNKNNFFNQIKQTNSEANCGPKFTNSITLILN